jgi:hypothetical protein
MLSRVINHRFRPVLTLAVAAFSLLAVALPLSPAKAQCFGVDLGFACGGLGVGSWYTHPYPYGYASYYPNYYYYYRTTTTTPIITEGRLTPTRLMGVLNTRTSNGKGGGSRSLAVQVL